MLDPEVVEFTSGALAALGGHYTGEIQFSGKSARVARRLSQRATMGQVRSFLHCSPAAVNLPAYRAQNRHK